MKNGKFIIYNKTKSFTDFEVFELINSILVKGLISGENNLYCYASLFNYKKFRVAVEFIKTNYGYKIYVIEENK